MSEPEVKLEIWGDFACFTAPYGKVERLTYPFPTPSAARGIFSAIYMKPKEFVWQIRSIEVLNPIRYINLKRNEVRSKISGKNYIWTDEDRTQRQTVALRDVHYRISAAIIPRDAFIGREQQLYDQAMRRIRNGKVFMQPSLGLREFIGYFEEANPGGKAPIKESLDAGLMIYDVFDYMTDVEVKKKTTPRLSLFHAVMENGVITIPPYNSPEVIKGDQIC